MQTRRGTVLGKRGHRESSLVPTAKTHTVCEQLCTPESSPNAKRPRTSLTLEDDTSNKENIPPLKDYLIGTESSPPRRPRALRRSATEDITPTRLGHTFLSLYKNFYLIHSFRYSTLHVYFIYVTVNTNKSNCGFFYCNATSDATYPFVPSSHPYSCFASFYLQ